MATIARAQPWALRRLRLSGATLASLGVFAGALALYGWTGAPSLLSGDQAEHQFTAWIVGVPHATGYPLFTMLNALAVRLLPFGDVARRVTLMVAIYSALAVLAAFWVARRISGRTLPGLVAAAAVACAPEFWLLATIAEVYTLQVFFIFATLWATLRWWEIEAADPTLGRERRGLGHPLAMASFLAGLGATHHGSFTPIVGPALVLTVALPLLARLRRAEQRPVALRLIGRAVLWAALGFTPWLYLAAQYVLFRPFDYYYADIWPYHLYWGNPQDWGDVFNLALGAGFRLKVFTHGWGRLPELLPTYLGQLRAQFWWVGSGLGGLGAVAAWRRSWRIGLWTTLVWLGGSFFGLNVAADVPKAHVYYLPAWMMWALWMGLGAWALAGWIERALARRPVLNARRLALPIVGGLALSLTLALGARRFDRLDRSGEWHFIQQGRATMNYVEPDAVILCRWEECMTLRYVQFVEGRGLGVQLDQTEPEGGVNWAERVPLYAPSPIYAVRPTAQLGERYPLLPIESIPDVWQVRR
jgi:hypothetical protein